MVLMHCRECLQPQLQQAPQGAALNRVAASAASSHDSDPQQGMDQLTECRVDCWNGEYVEARQQTEASGQQQDWMAHNKEVLHELQVP